MFYHLILYNFLQQFTSIEFFYVTSYKNLVLNLPPFTTHVFSGNLMTVYCGIFFSVRH